MPTVVVLSAVRTPFGRLLGSLSEVEPAALGGAAVSAALDRAGVRPGEVDRVALGNASAHALRGNPAAAAAAAAGVTAPASATIRAGCASGLVAVSWAAESILVGASRLSVAGGFESASQAPHLASGLRRGLRLGGGSLLDAARHDGPAAVAVGSEGDVERLRGALGSGALAEEIVPVVPPAGKRGAAAPVARDDAASEIEANAVPPSDASPRLADGAAALVLATASWAAERGLDPLARLRPAAPPFEREAAEARLIEADVTAPLAGELDRLLAPDRRAALNARGGAALLGHATGADGARLAVSLVHALRRAGGGRGLAIAAGAAGECAAVVIEV